MVESPTGLSEGYDSAPQCRRRELFPFGVYFALPHPLVDFLVGHPKMKIKFGGLIPE